MSIKAHLQTAKQALEAEKQREFAVAKEKATREKIVPYNQEIDKKREEAIAVLQKQHNANIVAEQERFANEKQALIDAGEKKKADNASLVIATETSVVTIKYDKAIAKINAQIEELED